MNNLQQNRNLASIILAAGQGKRMGLKEVNKVTMPLHGKPIILHIVHFMQKLKIKNVIIVVGHAKESVQHAVKGESVIFAVQKEQLGTGDALASALGKLPFGTTDIIVVYGDDAVLYADNQLKIIKELIKHHLETECAISLLTIEQPNPAGLGRIVRDDKGMISAIVEEKDATDAQKMITEINPGCFIFKVEFLKKYLDLVKKSPVTGEYYVTSLIDLAISHGESVETVRGGSLTWRGVNTLEELEEAKRLIAKI